VKGIDFPSSDFFTHEKAYRIQRDIKTVINPNVLSQASREYHVLKKYKLIYDISYRMTLVPKIRSVEPIIVIRRNKDWLYLTYNFTSLGQITIGAILMLVVGCFISDWKSLFFNPGVLFYLVLIYFWVIAVKAAKCIDRIFSHHELPLEQISDEIGKIDM